MVRCWPQPLKNCSPIDAGRFQLPVRMMKICPTKLALCAIEILIMQSTNHIYHLILDSFGFLFEPRKATIHPATVCLFSPRVSRREKTEKQWIMSSDASRSLIRQRHIKVNKHSAFLAGSISSKSYRDGVIKQIVIRDRFQGLIHLEAHHLETASGRSRRTIIESLCTGAV